MTRVCFRDRAGVLPRLESSTVFGSGLGWWVVSCWLPGRLRRGCGVNPMPASVGI